jgi:hypothetical protein
MRISHKAATLAIVTILMSRIAMGEPANDTVLPGKGGAPKSYQIANEKHGDLLRPKDANGSDGTPIVLYPAQPWKCMTWKLTPAGNADFTVRNHFTGKTFSLASSDNEKAILQIAVPHDAVKAVKWRFIKLKDGNYRITDPKTGNVLTAIRNEKDGEVRIALAPWKEQDEQKWELQEMDPAKLTM